MKIERCKEVRFYDWEGLRRKYYPDFTVAGAIVEIKGYRTARWEANHLANSDVIVLYEADIQPYLAYAVNTYGKDFVKLYGSATVLESSPVLKTG